MNDATTWTAVDDYFDQALLPTDPALDAALAASDAAGLPRISVSPSQGRMLELLARMQGAERVLEVGTLGGYSTIWLARGLMSGGRIVTLEVNPTHAEVARANVARAGLADVVEVRLGPGADTLRHLIDEQSDPFDLVFIDADKESNAEYFRLALELSRPGTVIVVDNVVRRGAVADAESRDSAVLGVRELTAAIAAEPRVRATVVQTVGGKGYDGFALIVVEK